jgi:hypothetical protein
LLDQKLTPYQIDALARKLSRNDLLLVGETQKLTEFFGVSAVRPYKTTDWRRKTGRMPKDVRYIVSKFKLGARHLLSEMKEAAPPKDYVRVLDHPGPQELAAWQRDHPNHPTGTPPPRYNRIYFCELPGFNLISRFYFLKNPNMTAQELIELGGGAYGAVAEPLLAYLRGLAKK